MKLKNLLLSIPLLMLLTNCRGTNSNYRPITLDTSLPDIVQFTPTTATEGTSSTKQSEPYVITPSGSPQPNDATDTKSIRYCQGEGVSLTPGQNYGIEGSIIFWDRQKKGFYLIGGRPLKEKLIDIPGSDIINLIGFSPDGSKLVYIKGNIFSGERSQITTLLANGTTITNTVEKFSLPIPSLNKDTIIPKFYWINNDLIYIHIVYRQNGYIKNSYLAILDVNDGKWQSQIYFNIPTYIGNQGISFSPTLLYGATIWPNYVTIWDINIRKEIIRISNIYGAQQIASWSPDSNWISLIGEDKRISNNKVLPQEINNLYLINSISGEVRQLTDYYGLYRYFYPEHLTWSPDGQQLAFSALVSIAGEVDREILYIYDVTTRNLKPFCWLYGGSLFSTTSNLIWSPDGQSIAYAQGKDIEPEKFSPLFVINLTDGSIKSIVDSAKDIGGWSIYFNP